MNAPNPYYSKITLEELGVDTELLKEHLKPTYDALPWDKYDVARGGLKTPTRKRSIAELEMSLEEGEWNAKHVSAKPYAQPTDHGEYNRTEPRPYPEVPQEVVSHPELILFIQKVSEIVRSVRSEALKLRVILTFLRAVDEEGRDGACALEGGPHVDSMDYIVSALVLNRTNLEEDSGESSVYDMEKNMLYKTVLQPGEGIFQDDINLMHHITDIKRKIKNKPGIRDMLGVDIQVLD